ncbi:transcriptional regulator [Brachybacterium ginsengisoli]|uniref:Transcriptional regulator n=1 Tax=Brachybacterium ginsengisoli TaxID=1331682 RepID=A0A291GY14_9MICO|nr:helix-turn-helix transcriptional regulator [Brachybacterium ginsengisoli]ATG55109.1 transcriptional regulator [Brachybacterium ginsengisoli]
MVRLPLSPEEIARGRRLGALLRRARGDRSILETALEAGMSPETLRKIETGRIATPAFPTIAALAQVLGISLDTLWDRATHEDPAEPGDADEVIATGRTRSRLTAL